MKTGRTTFFALSALTIIAGTAAATPVFTPISAPPGSEKNHAFILGQIYGGTWVADGLDFTNGTLTAKRVSDGGGTTLTLATSTAVTASDEKWAGDGQLTITVRPRYAGDNTTLGWIDDTQSEPIFQALADSRNLNGTATFNGSADFRWALLNRSKNNSTLTSRASDNAGVGSRSGETLDELVSYQILGNTNPDLAREWAMFWEDRRLGESDRDYNDAVFTVLASIPAPSATAALAAGAIFASRRRRVG
jgi:hypothetical protein